MVQSSVSFLLGRGAAAGAAAGSIISLSVKSITELAHRHLSDREQLRVGKAAYFTATRLKDHLDDGKEPRTDNFFNESSPHRSLADESMEGVLLKCQSGHREQKLPYICSIAANAPFSDASPDVPSSPLKNPLFHATAKIRGGFKPPSCSPIY